MLRKYGDVFLVALVGMGTDMLGLILLFCCAVGIATGVIAVSIHRTSERADAERV